MEMKLITLKLFLDVLGIDSSIETINDRKRVQKTVYLGQLSKVDLGYRFGWYLKGPYSRALTQDYFGLAEDIESGDEGYKQYELKNSLKERLQKVSPLFTKPEAFPGDLEDWLELVASFDYLRRVKKLREEEADKILVEEKPNFAEYKDLAEEICKTAFPN